MGLVGRGFDPRSGYVSAVSLPYPQCFSRVTPGPSYTGAVDTSAEDYWPGRQFGLPQEGPRSTPTYLRRVAALGIDWVIAVGISVVAFNYSSLATLGVFIAVSMLGGLFFAGTPGHLSCGIRIAPVKGGALGIVAPLVRPLLVAAVIPALIGDDDMRGGHDRLVGTILVRR